MMWSPRWICSRNCGGRKRNEVQFFRCWWGLFLWRDTSLIYVAQVLHFLFEKWHLLIFSVTQALTKVLRILSTCRVRSSKFFEYIITPPNYTKHVLELYLVRRRSRARWKQSGGFLWRNGILTHWYIPAWDNNACLCRSCFRIFIFQQP